jgi:hypothetical protein
MNRTVWTESITDHKCPAWSCTICNKGILELISKTLVSVETVESKKAHAYDEWDPDWVKNIFTVWAKCGNANCGQQYAISGIGGIEFTYTSEGETDFSSYYFPKLCIPMPDIANLPTTCPPEVKKELRASFELFWSNQDACASRIRVALERLMDHLVIPKKRKDAKGKFHDLSLHNRIELFTSEEKTIGEQLMAIKWLGNKGSHFSLITKDDLLDGYEIIEHALAEIIEGRSARVAQLAKRLLKKHSPK